MSDPYISEVKYLGSANQDFIEVVVDAGTDVSGIVVTVYHADGTVRSTNELETLATTIAGKDVYLITTGHTLWAQIKAMLTGWDEVEQAEQDSKEKVSPEVENR